MDDEKLFAMFFAAVGSIRFHPANFDVRCVDWREDAIGKLVLGEIRFAASVARCMVAVHKELDHAVPSVGRGN